VALVCLPGCAHHGARQATSPAPPQAATQPAQTFPILYHRTGGIAGTDDRVVIWADGVVQVQGRLLVPATTRLADDRFIKLHKLFDGFSHLKDRYIASDVADAYTITISYGGKSVEATDLAPDLPSQFRQIFGEIETIAGEAAAGPAPVPPDAGP
jgi:hypothetical protein